MLRSREITKSFDSFFVPEAQRTLAGGGGGSRNHRHGAFPQARPGRNAGQALRLSHQTGPALLPERGLVGLLPGGCAYAPPPANVQRTSGAENLVKRCLLLSTA